MTLNLPNYDVRTAERDGTEMVYDPFRQKYVQRTPEEWVRQHFLRYLTTELGVPRGLVAVEQKVTVNDQPQRADVVVYDRRGDPLLLVECKAPDTAIQQAAFDQGARYNAVLGAPFLVVTNGLTHYACRIDLQARTYAFLDDLPPYAELLAERGGD
jgi:hypothetical protein